jgi:hypothetical protein
MNLEAYGWHKADYGMAVQLTACTQTPGIVFPLPITDLDSSLTDLPGLKSAWISGYAQPTLLTPTVSGVGALVVEREDKGIGKGYVSKFVMDDASQVWWKAIPKPYPGHHFDTGVGINLGTLFSRG